MPNYPVPVSSGGRLSIASSRALTAVEHQTLIQTAKVHATQFVAQQALFAVADLSNLEGELIKAVPLAAPRLESIGNTAAIIIASHVGRMAYS
jgi:hypothetical protein